MSVPFSAQLRKVLARAGAKFHIDANYFAKNMSFVTLSHGLNVIRGIFTGYLVARVFPPDVYGSYKFVLHVMGVVSLITIDGLTTSIARDISQNEDTEVPLQWTMKINTLCCLAGSLILLGCIAVLPHWGRMDLWPLFCIGAVLFTPYHLINAFYEGIVTGKSKFQQDVYVNATQGMLVIVAVTPILLAWRSPAALLLTLLGIPTLIRLLKLRDWMRSFVSTVKSWRILKYGTELSINTLFVSSAFYLDGFLISAYFGLNELALFSVALLFPEQIKTWCKSLLPVSFVRQAQGEDTQGRRRQLCKIVAYGTVMFALGAGVYIAIAPYIMPVLFPLYPAEQLIKLTRIAGALLVLQPAILFMQFLQARGMVREQRWTQWTASACFIVALWYWLPTYGLVGALLARGLFRLLNVTIPLVFILRIPKENS